MSEITTSREAIASKKVHLNNFFITQNVHAAKARTTKITMKAFLNIFSDQVNCMCQKSYINNQNVTYRAHAGLHCNSEKTGVFIHIYRGIYTYIQGYIYIFIQSYTVHSLADQQIDHMVGH